MATRWQEEIRPGAALLSLVQEATTALIAMDAKRLEELARCCADLNRELHHSDAITEVSDEIARSRPIVDLFGRILVETRANLVVLSRLHVMHLRRHFAMAEKQDNQASTFSSTTLYGSGEFYGDN